MNHFPPFLQPERRPLLSNKLPPSDDDEIFRRNPIRLFSGHRMGRETGSPGLLFDQSSDDILFSKSHPICIWSNGRTLWTWGGTWDGLTLQVNDFIMKLNFEMNFEFQRIQVDDLSQMSGIHISDRCSQLVCGFLNESMIDVNVRLCALEADIRPVSLWSGPNS